MELSVQSFNGEQALLAAPADSRRLGDKWHVVRNRQVVLATIFGASWEGDVRRLIKNQYSVLVHRKELPMMIVVLLSCCFPDVSIQFMSVKAT